MKEGTRQGAKEKEEGKTSAFIGILSPQRTSPPPSPISICKYVREAGWGGETANRSWGVRGLVPCPPLYPSQSKIEIDYSMNNQHRIIDAGWYAGGEKGTKKMKSS